MAATDALKQLLARIVADPDDLAPRLVYADLLLARGDPRGTFIQAQCSGAHDVANVLLAKHFFEWTQAFGVTADVTFVNGFVEQWRCDAPAFLARAGRVLKKTPLRRLVVSPIDERLLRALLTSTMFRGLREIELHELTVWPFRLFAAGESFKQIRRLVFTGSPRGRPDALEGMLHQPWFASVRELGLDLPLNNAELEPLTQALPQLVELHLRGRVPRTHAPQLERLEVHGLQDDDEGLELMLRQLAPKLRELTLVHGKLNARVSAVLLGSKKLERLTLLETDVPEKDRAALAERFTLTARPAGP